jgi:glycosyltransferase involved in cell wall biosynthesis
MILLLVTPYSPFSASFGAEQRSKLLFEAMQEHGVVDVLVLQEKAQQEVQIVSLQPKVVQVSRRARRVDLRRYSCDHDIMHALNGIIDFASYDIVCGRHLGPISRLEIPSHVPTLVDLDDLDYSYSSPGFGMDVLWASAKSLVRRLLERRALRHFSAFWFVSERERIRHPELKGFVLPNIPFSIPVDPPEQSTSNRILFVGALWYGPNRAGIERFLVKSWPTIRAAVPDASLRLVGGAPVEDRKMWSTIEGVEAVGFVEDLAAEYCEAAVCIAPIHFGGGTNIKVLEASANGRGCVTTEFCRAAFAPFFDQRGTLAVGRTDREIADLCVNLLRDRTVRATFAREGHQVVLKHFNASVFRQAVSLAIEQVAGTDGSSADAGGQGPARQ